MTINKPRLRIYNTGDPVLTRFKLPHGGVIGVDRDFFTGEGCNGFVAVFERARRHYIASGCRFLAAAADDLIMSLFV